MIKSTTDKRVQPHDLRMPDDEIRNNTGWDDPVDSVIEIAKIAGVNAHKVTIKEKRRRTKEVGQIKKTQDSRAKETFNAATRRRHSNSPLTSKHPLT